MLLAACCRHKGSVRVFGKLLPSLGLREDAARLFEAEGDDILYDEEKSGHYEKTPGPGWHQDERGYYTRAVNSTRKNVSSLYFKQRLRKTAAASTAITPAQLDHPPTQPSLPPAIDSAAAANGEFAGMAKGGERKVSAASAGGGLQTDHFPLHTPPLPSPLASKVT